MRTVKAGDIIEAVRSACVEAAIVAGDDLTAALSRARRSEESEVGRMVLDRLLDNIRVAGEQRLPICQDTGLAVCFVERGEDVRVEGGTMPEAINEGVRRGYADGYLRKSTCDPFTRKNLGDNTPAIIHTEITAGDRLVIHLMAKGGGSENMSAVGMLKPSQGWPGVRDLVVSTVSKAGANPCPPIIVGVGVGGNFELAAINSKKALLRPLGEPNPDPEAAALENELLIEINKLGIGPQGYGGRTTALGVMLIIRPCHLASLPVAVNIQCHASRHRAIRL